MTSSRYGMIGISHSLLLFMSSFKPFILILATTQLTEMAATSNESVLIYFSFTLVENGAKFEVKSWGLKTGLLNLCLEYAMTHIPLSNDDAFWKGTFSLDSLEGHVLSVIEKIGFMCLEFLMFLSWTFSLRLNRLLFPLLLS